MRKVVLCSLMCVFGLLQLSAQKFDWRGGKIRIAVQGGFSWRLDKVAEVSSDELKDYLKGLKTGSHIGFDVNYFFVENLGLGVKYNKDTYKGSLDDVTIPINDKLILSNTSDDININFFGPALCFLSNGESQAVSASLAYGFLGYKNKSTLNGNTIDYEGKTGGIALDLGYEFFITHYISLGAQLSYLTGVLEEVKYTSGNFTEDINIKTDYKQEGLNRINISAGLRFYIK